MGRGSVAGDDGADDGEPEAGAGDGALLCVGGAEETGEQLLLVGWRDADAGVVDAHHRGSVIGPGADVDAAALGGELDHVGQQVDERPVELAGVCLHDEAVLAGDGDGDGEGELCRRHRRADGIGGVRDDLGDVHGPFHRGHGAGFQLGEHEHVIDEVPQP